MKIQYILFTLFFAAFGTISHVSADTFVPEQNFNTFTVERYKAECGITGNTETTQFCEYAPNSSELAERLKIMNWYADFDIMMRQKMYGEVIWDYGDMVWDDNQGKFVPSGSTRGAELAYEELSDYGDRFNSWAHRYLRDKNYTETEFKDSVRSNFFAMTSSLEFTVVGFKRIESIKEKLVEDGHLKVSDENASIYIGDIDEIQTLMKKHYFPYWHQDDVVLYEDIYFPNVRKFLELEKKWSPFYRTSYSGWTSQDFEDHGYNTEEIIKVKNGEYINSFKSKVDFEYNIEQDVEGTILDGNLPETSNAPKPKTKLEQYEVLWNKSIDDDYDRIFDVIENYADKQKRKGKSSSYVNNLLSKLGKQLPTLVNSYEKKYQTSTGNTKTKYQNYVWILLVLEKVLEENIF